MGGVYTRIILYEFSETALCQAFAPSSNPHLGGISLNSSPSCGQCGSACAISEAAPAFFESMAPPFDLLHGCFSHLPEVFEVGLVQQCTARSRMSISKSVMIASSDGDTT